MRLQKLKVIRLEHNLTQQQVADILHIKRCTYSSFETGRDTIPIEKLNLFIEYFDVSYDFMLDLDIKRNKGDYVRNYFNKKLIGERLKSTRKEKKLTQQDVANLLNTRQSVWCRYELGETLITVPFLYAYARKIKISADYLIGRSDIKYDVKPLVVIEEKDEYALSYN